jgi:hypothetical protein
LQAYLAQEFMVAITGSKFVGGPAFCGALMLPPGVARRGRAVALNALVDYSARSDWPADWQSARVLQESANLGQLLRWEAALVELHRFKAIPEQHTHDFLYTWQQAVSKRLAQDDTFEPLPVMALSRRSTSGQPAWDGVQTIMGFRVFKRIAGGGRQVLSLEETTQLYQQLRAARCAPEATGARFQLGQPVLCGQQDGTPVGALRLCSGARLVTESMAKHQSVTCAIEQAMLALDQIAQLAQALR